MAYPQRNVGHLSWVDTLGRKINELMRDPPIVDERLPMLPTSVVRTLKLYQYPVSMDFHPLIPTLLLVGTSGGRIILSQINDGKRLFKEEFVPDQPELYSASFKECFARDSLMSIKRVIWNCDGTLFGVSSSKNLARIYSYSRRNQVKQNLEIECHDGSVNDVGFAPSRDKPFFITCGDDKMVKVWNSITGELIHTFSDHQAHVTIVTACKNCIISVSLAGQICMYDYTPTFVYGFRLPGYQCQAIVYTPENNRIFASWKTSKGRSIVFEMSEKFYVMTPYGELLQPFSGQVPIDVVGDRFLGAGDEFSVKLWDVNTSHLLERIQLEAEGGLNVRPRIRSSKKGEFLAVSGKNNTIIILANQEGKSICKGVRKFRC